MAPVYHRPNVRERPAGAVRMQVRAIKLFEHEQKEQWYLDINPNGRIPAIVDTNESGHELKIWESGAILQYLVDRYDKDHKISYPHGSEEYWQMTNWVGFAIFQNLDLNVRAISNLRLPQALLAGKWPRLHARPSKLF